MSGRLALMLAGRSPSACTKRKPGSSAPLPAPLSHELVEWSKGQWPDAKAGAAMMRRTYLPAAASLSRICRQAASGALTFSSAPPSSRSVRSITSEWR
jgi:hypothetical protein